MERRKKTNIMNWRTLLLLAILLPLPTELAAQKKKRGAAQDRDDFSGKDKAIRTASHP